MPRKKMGEILLEKKLITEQDLDKALLKQKGQKKPLGEILEEMDLVLEEDIAQTLATQFGFPFVKKIARFKFSRDTLSKVDSDTALTKLIFPLKIEGKSLYLAMANPLDMPVQSELSFKLGLRIAPCVATPTEIKAAIKAHYHKDVDLKSVVRSNSPTILIVDRQQMILSTIEGLLKQEGYAVHQAQSGLEALKLADSLQPDVVLTELSLPQMDGVRLYEEIRKNSSLRETRVVIFTAKASPEDEARLLDMGVDDFVAKPLQPLRLLARIRKALRR